MAGFGALSFLCGKIFPAKPAQSTTAVANDDQEVGADATDDSTTAPADGKEGEESDGSDKSAEDGNKKASASYSFSSLLGLISAICGIVSLYVESNTVHLFRTYQTFIALSLIGLIPVRKYQEITI